jgi:hypothetical protein
VPIEVSDDAIAIALMNVELELTNTSTSKAMAVERGGEDIVAAAISVREAVIRLADELGDSH